MRSRCLEAVRRTGQRMPICRPARCHGGVATLLRRHGNVVTGAWQRCYGGVATLLWVRGNVVMGSWQRTERYIVMKTKDGETKTRGGETTRREHVATNGLRGRSAKWMAEELTGATARLHGPYASINHAGASWLGDSTSRRPDVHFVAPLGERKFNGQRL